MTDLFSNFSDAEVSILGLALINLGVSVPIVKEDEGTYERLTEEILLESKKRDRAKKSKKAGKFEVWMEGYKATGGSSEARYLGTYEAATFEIACRIAGAENSGLGGYDSKSNTIWGCRLFDNERDARRSFG